MKCPKCSTQCDHDEIDVGIGTIFGPWGCSGCYWSEDERYDLSEGQSNQRNGGTIDQKGGWKRNSPALFCMELSIATGDDNEQ